MAKNKIPIKRTAFTKKFEETFDILPEQNIMVAKELVNELSFMNGIINDLKKTISEKGATYTFENGSQVMQSQTPEFKSYMEITNRYNQYFKQLLTLYPKELKNDIESSLEQFLNEKVN